MADERAAELPLTLDELRVVSAYSAECATEVLAIFETARPADERPRAAIDAAIAFARGGKRGKALRVASLAALKAANEAEDAAAEQAARAAMCAASAAYLHPLARATQVRHILGAAAHAARATEVAAGDAPSNGDAHVQRAASRASPEVVAVLRRYPPAPPKGGRVGELIRALDRSLRATS